MQEIRANALAILRRPKPVSAWIAAIVYLMAAPKLAPAGFDDRYLNLWFLSAIVVFCAWTFAAWRLQDLRRERLRGAGYRVFTRDFDRVIHAADLDQAIGRMTEAYQAELEAAWDAFSTALQCWRTQAHLAALDASTRLRQAVGRADLGETTATLLVDQSGSMRGQNMLLAATAVDVACDFLVNLGVSVEVLGFTTASWKGGQSRVRWLGQGRPECPGRLCDLLHIVYRSVDDPGAGTGGWSFRPMLRPDILKENVDGEALEWAASWLLARDRPRRILLVISDGAPVDDSTLSANWPTILVDHLLQVIGRLEGERQIRLAAVGIGHDVDRYYSISARVETPDALGEAVIGLLERVLVDPPLSGEAKVAVELSPS